tara:strand:- start:40 stop:504 length:465 start_codon:yes stop_codon:yes gene_type:complete
MIFITFASNILIIIILFLNTVILFESIYIKKNIKKKALTDFKILSYSILFLTIMLSVILYFINWKDISTTAINIIYITPIVMAFFFGVILHNSIKQHLYQKHITKKCSNYLEQASIGILGVSFILLLFATLILTGFIFLPVILFFILLWKLLIH